MIDLTGNVALEMGGQGVNVNIVQAGLVETDSTRALPGSDKLLALRRARSMVGDRMLEARSPRRGRCGPVPRQSAQRPGPGPDRGDRRRRLHPCLAHVCAFLRSSVCNPLKAQGRVSVFEKV